MRAPDVRRQPIELWLCFTATLAGLLFAFGPSTTPSSVQVLLPRWVLWGWYGALLLGGLIGCAANVWPRRHVRLVLELTRSAMTFLFTGCAGYASALVAVNGWRATGAALATGSLAAMCLWRGLKAHLDLRLLDRLIQQQSSGELGITSREPP